MCRGAMMVRELEQIGTDEKHTCAYVIRQQTRSAWLANLLRASNDHQSNILSINNVRVVYDVYIDERVQHCCTALIQGSGRMRCPVGDAPRGTWMGRQDTLP